MFLTTLPLQSEWLKGRFATTWHSAHLVPATNVPSTRWKELDSLDPLTGVLRQVALTHFLSIFYIAWNLISCCFLLLHLAQLTPATPDYTRLATFNWRTIRFLILSSVCRAGSRLSRFQTRRRHGRERPFPPATAGPPFCTSGKSSTQRRFFMYSSCRTLSTTSCHSRLHMDMPRKCSESIELHLR